MSRKNKEPRKAIKGKPTSPNLTNRDLLKKISNLSRTVRTLKSQMTLFEDIFRVRNEHYNMRLDKQDINYRETNKRVSAMETKGDVE